MLLSTCGVPQICIWGPHIVVLCLVDEMIDEGVGRTQREWWLTRPGSMACCWPGDPDAPTGLERRRWLRPGLDHFDFGFLEGNVQHLKY